MRAFRLAWTAGAAVFALAGCHTDMWRQPRVSAQEGAPVEVFPDGIGDRPPVPGTVARGILRHDDLRYRGREGGKLAKRLPPHLVIEGETLSTTDPEDLEKILRRGYDRFKVFCRHCHGALGDGNGMIAQRGLTLRRQPGNYHTDRLREMPIGHFFDVITNGYGTMFSYASRIEPDDRWAVAAYIRALQLSQNARVDDLPAEDRDKIEAAGSNAAEGGHE